MSLLDGLNAWNGFSEPTRESLRDMSAKLSAAAQLIEVRGHYKGDFAASDAANAPVCLLGAIYAAHGQVFRHPCWDPKGVMPVNPDGYARGRAAQIQACLHVVRNALHEIQDDTVFGTYNDAPERTAREVVSLLQGTAERVSELAKQAAPA